MKLPTIDLSLLPELAEKVGVFGATARLPVHDDSIVVLAAFLFEANPPGSGLI